MAHCHSYKDDYYLLLQYEILVFRQYETDLCFTSEFPGVLSVAAKGETLYACSMNQKNVYKCIATQKRIGNRPAL